MKTGSHSDRSERTTGEPETAETAARQPDVSAASPATRSHRQIDGSALTSNECPHTKVFVTDSTMRRNQVPCPWCKDTEIERLHTVLKGQQEATHANFLEIERLRAALVKYGHHTHPNCHDLTLKEDGSFGPRNGCLCGFDAFSGDSSSPETSPNVWQPIETAPADGTEFIAFHKLAGVCACFRTGPTSNWYCMDGWNTYTQADGSKRPGLTSFIDPPECWMPMPKPPGSAVETSERPLTLGKLIVETAHGDVKERKLTTEEVQQVREGIAQKTSAESEDDECYESH